MRKNKIIELKNNLKSIFDIKEKPISFEFHKYRFELLFLDKIFSIIIFILLALFEPNLILIGTYFLLIPYLVLSKRIEALKYLILSSIISLIWLIFANDLYGYNKEMVLFLGFNSFPLFAWALGLFSIYMMYAHWYYILKTRIFIFKFIFFCIIYLILLLSAETIGYHVLNIKNLTTSMYLGLPICDCIHAPVWMQITYLLLGPVYMIISYIIGLKNPNYEEIEN